MKEYKTVFISDVHLGAYACQDDALYHFLNSLKCQNLYLVGDIIDGWALKRKIYWPETHKKLVNKVLQMAKDGVNVYYLAGNHDEALRDYLPIPIEGNIEFMDSCEYISVSGMRFFITHGDMFDEKAMSKKRLSQMGDWWYMTFLRLNRPINQIRALLGYKEYWSLAKWAKQGVKKLIMKKTNYDEMIYDYLKKNDYDGIVCGHIHNAKIKQIHDKQYINTGDWIESKTAIVERLDGEIELLQL